MDPEQREDIFWRDGLSMISMAAALFHHHNYIFSQQFIMKERRYSKPFGLHSILEKVIASMYFKQGLLIW